MRVFVAVDIPERIRLGISKLQDFLSGRGVREIRWTRPSGIHLTLRFCGEIAPETVRLLSEACAPGTPVYPFRVALSRLETFPPRGLPRVLVISTAESAGLQKLAEWVGKRSEAVGIPTELRRFHPHLTLGRFRSGARRLSALPGELGEELSRQEMEVDRFKIFQSHLGPDGARYEVLAEIPLLGENAA